MANVKITDLTAVTTPAASDLLEIVNSGANKKIQRQHLFYGTQTNDNAAAGYIGELLSGDLAFASRVAVLNATAKSIISVSLTAGDWDVSGYLVFYPAATTSINNLISNVSLTNNTLEQGDTTRWVKKLFGGGLVTGQDHYGLPVPMTRISLASTTTVYLVAYTVFSVSTMEAFGKIIARRVR